MEHNCQTFENLVVELLDHKYEDSKNNLQEHISYCPNCKNDLEKSNFFESVNQLKNIPVVKTSDDFMTKLESKINLVVKTQINKSFKDYLSESISNFKNIFKSPLYKTSFASVIIISGIYIFNYSLNNKVNPEYENNTKIANSLRTINIKSIENKNKSDSFQSDLMNISPKDEITEYLEKIKINSSGFSPSI